MSNRRDEKLGEKKERYRTGGTNPEGISKDSMVMHLMSHFQLLRIDLSLFSYHSSKQNTSSKDYKEDNGGVKYFVFVK